MCVCGVCMRVCVCVCECGCWTFTEAGKCNKDLTSSLKASSKNSAIFHFWDSLLCVFSSI